MMMGCYPAVIGKCHGVSWITENPTSEDWILREVNASKKRAQHIGYEVKTQILVCNLSI
jgi:hypothetical protein